MHPILQKYTLKQSVTNHPCVSRNGAGKPTYGEPFRLTGYYEGGTHVVRDFTGQILTFSGLLILDSKDLKYIHKDDRLEADDGSSGEVKRIYSIPSPLTGELDHLEVYI